jgi:plasmid stability protein
MAQLIVRNLPEDVVESLKKRAASHNRSAEAEHREILIDALLGKPRKSFEDFLLEMPDGGTDEDFNPPRDKRQRKVNLR